MKRALIIFFVLALVLVGAVSGASAYGGSRHGHSAGILGLLTQLNLTDAQKQTIATILKSNQNQSQTLRANLKTAKQNLRTAINTPNATEAAIRTAYKPVAAAVEELIVNRAQVMAQVKKVLTPDQLTQLAQIKQDRLAKKQHHPKTGKSLTDEWIDKYSSK
ncbi:MAG: Spy/CpxP family protein refolding chaperone [Deltaproteobacteria bacterium]|nr:Spy/CpxP family protein refolding chaperone [Deltaproteobacteria bacterium]